MLDEFAETERPGSDVFFVSVDTDCKSTFRILPSKKQQKPCLSTLGHNPKRTTHCLIVFISPNSVTIEYQSQRHPFPRSVSVRPKRGILEFSDSSSNRLDVRKALRTTPFLGDDPGGPVTVLKKGTSSYCLRESKKPPGASP